MLRCMQIVTIDRAPSAKEGETVITVIDDCGINSCL